MTSERSNPLWPGGGRLGWRGWLSALREDSWVSLVIAAVITVLAAGFSGRMSVRGTSEFFVHALAVSFFIGASITFGYTVLAPEVESAAWDRAVGCTRFADHGWHCGRRRDRTSARARGGT